MAAERRENPRFPMTLECAIRTDNRGFRRCKTRDISQDGLFVVTGDGKVAGNPTVDLAVKTNLDGQSRVHQYRALVRRTTDDGLGLLFCRMPGERALVDLVLKSGRL